MARSMHIYKYSGSNNVDEVAWCGGNSDFETHPVKTKKANKLGLYDMSGNVREWSNDRFGDYQSSPQTNPSGPAKGGYRVVRGGSWYNYGRNVRVSLRYGYAPGYRFSNLGFRLAL